MTDARTRHPTRRRWSFTLRTLLFLVLLVGSVFGLLTHRWRQFAVRRQVLAEAFEIHFSPTPPSWRDWLVADSELAHQQRLEGRKCAGDPALAHVAGMQELCLLVLNGTQVSDAGLDQLRGLTNLKWIDLSNTNVTEKGAERLRAALPNCPIAH